MKQITSISLGSSARDKAANALFLGEEFSIERGGTNVMGGVLVALSGKKPADLTPEDYMSLLQQLKWDHYRVQTLNP